MHDMGNVEHMGVTLSVPVLFSGTLHSLGCCFMHVTEMVERRLAGTELGV